MDALDISNNTTRFTVDQAQQWKEQGIGLAIIQLISGVHLAGDDCATQIRTCLDAGLAVDCYLFPGNDGLPLNTDDRLALVPDDVKSQVRQLWVDVEPAYLDPDQSSINTSHTICDAWASWQRTGDYSALWVANKMLWHPWPWPDRKQWLVYVRNDGVPNFGGAFDGTDNHVMTQYRMDVTESGVSGMDRSRLSDEEAAAVEAWLNGGTGDVDDAERKSYQDKIDGLVTTVADIADRLGDQLLTEAKRSSMRKAAVRSIVQEMQAERVQAVGPRP